MGVRHEGSVVMDSEGECRDIRRGVVPNVDKLRPTGHGPSYFTSLPFLVLFETV